ncbi:Pkinase-domain-containing protein [Massarina eburnea CBS 473.64]|uniref:non-specific serine/threonine protein kinase n=1 Tax=Massarina eburnea CBS 473.64 TaxID=1395130 RepID=A0A6A6SEP8_9PLEO|nr:Pkinase-domain-containing protein [Massarina eburnea CBS 473.64]
MPATVTKPPTLVTSLHSEPGDSPLLRRDSRLDQTPIAEEDEGKPITPITPTSHTSDSITFTHPFRHDDAGESLSIRTGDIPRARPSPGKMDDQSSSPPDKPNIGKRAASFVRNKLHRSSSHKDAASPSAEKTKNAQADKSPSALKVNTERLTVKTAVDGPADMATPAVNIPKSRRLSSFSLSARNSPKTSQTNSPPSSASPTSTISDSQSTTGNRPKHGHKHSVSSTTLSTLNKPRPGVSWAGNNGRGAKRHTWSRRRSASQEQLSQVDADDETPTAGMLSTFSKPAARGVGMKARRLSVSLPDEFVVDCCVLDKEYKSSSLMPGKRGKCLGKGATAEVRIMARRGFHTEELVAVKEFRSRDKSESEEEYIQKIKSEYCIAKSLHHPNIVETIRLCTNHGRWNHVMEYCAHGELYSLVERKLFAGGTEGYYSADDRLCFFKQLLRGVDYLHSHGIAHRDIKLENLLLHKDGHLKISDFGVAEVFSGEHPGLRAAAGECGKNMSDMRLSAPGICGSLPYIAPEVLEKKKEYDPRPLDVWSCAIVYLTMTFGGCPWQAAKPEFEYYARFKKGWDEWLPEHPDGKIFDGVDGHPKCGKLFSLINPPAVKRLMLKMLHPNPDMRITIREVLETSFVRGVNCCCPESYEDPKYCVDASKASKTTDATPVKKYLHHHIPPKHERKIAKVLTHRFDMGDGYQ